MQRAGNISSSAGNGVSALEVRAALERVLSSAGFARSPRPGSFLRFVVEETLAGRGGELKESLIGVEVFRRRADYEPRLDPIVRVEASKLRARLADYYHGPGRSEPVVIGIPKGGYAPVWHANGSSLLNKPWKSPLRFAALALGAAGVATAIAAGIWRVRSTGVEGPVLPVVPLTSYLGTAEGASFSPDGNQVAFSWNGEERNNRDIYVKLLGAPTPRRLTTHPDSDVSPAFSPDGRWIAFVRVAGGRSRIFLIPAIGGPERLLGEFPDPESSQPQHSPRLAWLPDGKWLVTNGLYLLSAESGEVRRLTTGSAAWPIDYSPGVSPEGHRVVFSRGTGLNSFDLFLLELDGELKPKGAARQLTSLGGLSNAAVWTPDGREILFMNHLRLWKLAASGAGKPRPFPFSPGTHNSLGDWWPALSRQGDRLVFSRDTHDVNIWRVALSSPQPASASRFIASSRDEFAGDYSPDGKRIAFASNRSGYHAIWVSDADGSNAMELAAHKGEGLGSPRWSPDGKRIVYDSNETIRLGAEPSVYVIQATGGKPARVNVGPAWLATWSRDGKWIYFCSTRSGRYEVWKGPVAGGDAVQVTRNGGLLAFESEDGKYLYFSRPGSGVFKMGVNGGEESQLLPPPTGGRNFLLAPRGIYFVAFDGPHKKFGVRFLSFAAGAITTVALLPGEPSLGFAVSPDHRYILYSQMDTIDVDLMMVENRGGRW